MYNTHNTNTQNITASNVNDLVAKIINDISCRAMDDEFEGTNLQYKFSNEFVTALSNLYTNSTDRISDINNQTNTITNTIAKRLVDYADIDSISTHNTFADDSYKGSTLKISYKCY